MKNQTKCGLPRLFYTHISATFPGGFSRSLRFSATLAGKSGPEAFAAVFLVRIVALDDLTMVVFRFAFVASQAEVQSSVKCRVDSTCSSSANSSTFFFRRFVKLLFFGFVSICCFVLCSF